VLTYICLSDVYKKAFHMAIKVNADYEAVFTVVQDRKQWRALAAKVIGVFCELRGTKIKKRREARAAKEALERE
jgi:hypothetical protein